MPATFLVMTNVPDAACAEVIARACVERRLAACVTEMPVRSTYRWQGAIETAQELTLLMKTSASRYAALEACIRELHPYDLPEIVAWPIEQGLGAYLQWIETETRNDELA